MSARVVMCLVGTMLLFIQIPNHASSQAEAPKVAELVAVVESGGFAPWPGYLAIDSTGQLFGLSHDLTSDWVLIGQCPAGRPVSIRLGGIFNNFVVGMANGDVYTFPPVTQFPPVAPVQFTFVSNVFGSTVEASRETWGALKGAH